MRLGLNVFDLRKTISCGAACAALLAGSVAAKAQEIRLNEVLRSLFYTPQYVALRIGAFEQEGLKIAGPKTTWGAQATLTEIVSGNSDIALTGPEAVALTQQAGPDRRLINFAALTDADGSFIISKTPMAGFKIADLKGKTIVTSGKGSTPVLALEYLVRQAGLDPSKDVHIRNIPVSANVLPSYLEPNTQFAQSFEPGVTQMIAQGKGYRVASVGALLGPLPYTAYVTTVSYLEKNPKTIQSFTNAIYKALIWTDAHTPDEIAKLIAPDFKNVPEDTITTVVAEYKKVNTWAKSPVITPEGMKKMLDLLVGGGIVKEAAPYDRVVNPSFAQKAEQTIKR